MVEALNKAICFAHKIWTGLLRTRPDLLAHCSAFSPPMIAHAGLETLATYLNQERPHTFAVVFCLAYITWAIVCSRPQIREPYRWNVFCEHLHHWEIFIHAKEDRLLFLDVVECITKFGDNSFSDSFRPHHTPSFDPPFIKSRKLRG